MSDVADRPGTGGIASELPSKYLPAVEYFKQSLAFNSACDRCQSYIDESSKKYKDMHYQQGMAAFNQEDLTRAIAEWALVYDLDPGYLDVERNLKKARHLQERLDSIKRSQKKPE